jgi:hypothetical protein
MFYIFANPAINNRFIQYFGLIMTKKILQRSFDFLKIEGRIEFQGSKLF